MGFFSWATWKGCKEVLDRCISNTQGRLVGYMYLWFADIILNGHLSVAGLLWYWFSLCSWEGLLTFALYKIMPKYFFLLCSLCLSPLQAGLRKSPCFFGVMRGQLYFYKSGMHPSGSGQRGDNLVPHPIPASKGKYCVTSVEPGGITWSLILSSFGVSPCFGGAL